MFYGYFVFMANRADVDTDSVRTMLQKVYTSIYICMCI